MAIHHKNLIGILITTILVLIVGAILFSINSNENIVGEAFFSSVSRTNINNVATQQEVQEAREEQEKREEQAAQERQEAAQGVLRSLRSAQVRLEDRLISLNMPQRVTHFGKANNCYDYCRIVQRDCLKAVYWNQNEVISCYDQTKSDLAFRTRQGLDCLCLRRD
jgi:hypothetical protein